MRCVIEAGGTRRRVLELKEKMTWLLGDMSMDVVISSTL
jgi:hypothetical protein